MFTLCATKCFHTAPDIYTTAQWTQWLTTTLWMSGSLPDQPCHGASFYAYDIVYNGTSTIPYYCALPESNLNVFSHTGFITHKKHTDTVLVSGGEPDQVQKALEGEVELE